MNGWDRDKPQPKGRSEFSGTGRTQRTTLQKDYRPAGDTEGASMEGLLTRKEQEEKRRADND